MTLNKQQVEEILKALAQNKILVKQKLGYKLTFLPDQIKMKDIIDAINLYGINNLPFLKFAKIDELKEILKALNETASNLPQNKFLKNI